MDTDLWKGRYQWVGMPRGFCDYALKWLWGFHSSRRVTHWRTGGLVLSDLPESFAVVLVRNVSSPQIKKSQNRLEIGEWVCGNWWSWIYFKKVFNMVFNRSHAGGLRESYMNVDKIVYTNPVGKYDHGIGTAESVYISLCRWLDWLQLHMELILCYFVLNKFCTYPHDG